MNSFEEAPLDKANISKTLSNARADPTHEAFHFYRGLGDPTDEVATSLGDFFEKLRTIDVRSIEFHFQRQDFEKWIKDAVHDDELSRQISGISKEAHGEELREKIMKVVKSRLNEPLKSSLSQASEKPFQKQFQRFPY